MDEENAPLSHVLVIGGCGFLGSHIVNALVAHHNKPIVSVTSRSPDSNLVVGANYYECDISDQPRLESLVSRLKPTVIINTASPRANAGAKIFASTILAGTANSLACAKNSPSVKHYIYLSSSSVVTGAPFSLLTEDAAKLINPKTHHDPYCAAKATADALVLSSNQPGQLTTAVLRPSGIFGERDVQVVPGLLRGMDIGMSRVQLGGGKNKFDFVYAGNVADACVCCAEALVLESIKTGLPIEKPVGGEAFFITNNEPIEFWAFARLVWRIAGDRTPPEKIIVVPMWIAFALAWVSEWVVWTLTLGTRKPEKFNKTQMRFCSLNHTFCVDKARERLRWEPKVSLEEAVRRSVESVMEERKKS